MNSAEYSPFHGYNQENTAQRQTTSCKKYPINKYYQEQNDSGIKHQLFSADYQNLYSKQKRNNPHKKQNQMSLFANDSIKQTIMYDNSIHPNSLRQLRNKQHSQVINDSKNQHSLAKLSKNKTKTTRKRAQTTKTSAIQIKTKKSTSIKKHFQHVQQQLSMYKKLCMTLRKQNDQFYQKFQKQHKKQAKFSEQVQDLKGKIKKMYDYCIQKNKSHRNVDTHLRVLLEKHVNTQQKQNDRTFVNQKGSRNHLTKQSFKKVKPLGNKQTIQSTRTSKRDFDSSCNLKNEKSFRKRSEKLPNKPIVEKRKVQSSRMAQPPIKIIQYDQQSSDKQDIVQRKTHQNILEKDGQYKQFFTTFTKSLQIFQKNQTKQNKERSRLLKQGGYYVQWAKQQWLEIVQFLIKKGYLLGKQENKMRAPTSYSQNLR